MGLILSESPWCQDQFGVGMAGWGSGTPEHMRPEVGLSTLALPRRALIL